MLKTFFKSTPTVKAVSETCNILPSGLMTPRDAAVYLGVKINTLAVWRMDKRYHLPYIKVGKCIRYRKADLDIWLENRLQNSGGE